MAPINDATDPVYTVKEMVTEIRNDLKEVKTDVATLKAESAARQQVQIIQRNRFTAKEKLAGIAFAAVTTALNIMTLGPDIFR